MQAVCALMCSNAAGLVDAAFLAYESEANDEPAYPEQ